jgi:SNF2 family DNA or RNA helicase
MLQANLANPDDPDPRFIVFSQYDRMLHVLAASLKAEGIESVTCRGNRTRKEAALLKFRTSATCRVLMMSLSNATAAGTNLQVAISTRVLILLLF